VGTQLSGQIAEIRADFNTEVRAGDALALLDAKTFAAKVEQAEADLAMATAGLENQQAALEKAEAVLRQAERSNERHQALASRGITAQTTLDTATRDVDVARADIGVAKAQIDHAKANIALRKAALDQAKIDLDRTTIRAPINGTIVSRTVDVGQTVAASLQAPELFRIAQDLRRIRIEVQVNEADVGAISPGNPVRFTVDAYPDRQFQGRVSQIRLTATEVQNVVTYTVMVESENDDLKLYPGMTAQVQIETARRDDVLRIASEALRYKPRGAGLPQATSRTERHERRLQRFKERLKLTDAQIQFATEALAKSKSRTKGEGGADDETQPEMKQTRSDGGNRLERILVPLLNEEQRVLFETWKKGREGTRSATVWVLNAAGTPEARSVRIGLSDEQFAEIASGQLKENERVILRARESVRR
jgi:HlyD family secretion protein